MSIVDLLADPGMRPFEIAFAIVLGLLLIELVMNLMGLSALGSSDSDLDVSLDVGDAEIDVSEIDLSVGRGALVEMFDTGDADFDATTGESPEAPEAPASAGGVLSWLGLGQVPMTIWLAGLLTGFALSGYIVQLAVSQITGFPLGAVSAVMLAVAPALWFARGAARIIARLVPKTQTTAIARRSYHRRRGVITVGTAREGRPAQARFRDGHGNAHYTMVEPLDPKDALPQGTEILILRVKNGAPRALPLSEIPTTH